MKQNYQPVYCNNMKKCTKCFQDKEEELFFNNTKICKICYKIARNLSNKSFIQKEVAQKNGFNTYNQYANYKKENATVILQKSNVKVNHALYEYLNSLIKC